jgi:hypothetical protein
MKKSVLFLIVCLGFVLVACGNQSNTGGTSVPSASVSANRDANDVDLIVGANYYFELKDDKGNVSYKYGSWLQQGDTVLVLPGEVKTVKVLDANGNGMDDMIGPARLTSSELNKKDVGRDIFVSSYYILPKQRMGVIVAASEAKVFDGLEPSSVTGKALPRRTIIAVAPIDESKNPLKRQRFVAYNIPQADGSVLKAGVWAPLYINPVDVSLGEHDVKMAIQILKLDKKDKAQWGTAVSEAEKLYGDSVFVTDARAMIGQAQNEIAASAPKASTPVSLSGTINDENVNVRTTPDENNGSVIGRLSSGTSVTISEQTSSEYTVAGATARWYKVKSGSLEGWVFGAFLAVQ